MIQNKEDLKNCVLDLLNTCEDYSLENLEGKFYFEKNTHIDYSVKITVQVQKNEWK